MATWLLSLIIELRGSLPLYLLCSDVDGAYDNVWRDALWAKLASRHGNVYDVKLLMTIYRKMLTKFRMEIIYRILLMRLSGYPKVDQIVANYFPYFSLTYPMS